MAAFSKIRALLPSLSSSEEKLADFILSSPSALRDLSSQKLAASVGVSQSSVVKFAQKLSYKGYPALKLAILDDISNANANPQQLHGSIRLDDDYLTMSNKLVQSKIAVLQQTQSLNDQKAINQAVDLILKANRVMLTGLGGSALVAKDFCFKMQRLGITAMSEVDGHAQLALACTLNQDDVVFALSESGLTREVVNIVRQAKENQTPVISVTKFGATAVSNMADVKLYSVAEEASTRISSILARTAQELIIDVLFITLMQRSDKGRQLLEKSRKIVTQFRMI
ncbi:MAG: DNA-binding MurR/RpiR family transcriptional regulator [Alphaproteobacteria bacterium]|jgi:DNA-binding MurR/RpiR family transcriptional regulator